MSTKAIDQAQALVKSGKVDEARNLLLEQGFVRRYDPEIGTAYPKLIPPTPLLSIRLKGDLLRVADHDPDVRYQALAVMLREVFGEASPDIRAWCADPRATDVLIRALRDEEPRVVEKAAGVLSMVLSRYFADVRAFEPLSGLLKSRRKQTRVYATYGIGYLAHPDRWRALLPMFKDTTTDVRRTAVRVAVFNAPGSAMPDDTRSELMAEMHRLLSDPDTSTRGMAKTVLQDMGK